MLSSDGTTIWKSAPSVYSLSEGSLHLWKALLSDQVSLTDSLLCFLSEDERKRCCQFRHADLRQRYILCRGILRVLLSRYLSRPPETIHFSYTDLGKPYLEKAESNGIQFNLSHSQDLVVYGFTRFSYIGVDLESLERVKNADRLAKRFYSVNEYNILSSLPEDEKAGAFTRAWTRKEAYLKATGKGLSFPLSCIEVPLDEKVTAQLPTENGEVWTLHSFEPEPGFTGAAVYSGWEKQMDTFLFS